MSVIAGAGLTDMPFSIDTSAAIEREGGACGVESDALQVGGLALAQNVNANAREGSRSWSPNVGGIICISYHCSSVATPYGFPIGPIGMRAEPQSKDVEGKAAIVCLVVYIIHTSYRLLPLNLGSNTASMAHIHVFNQAMFRLQAGLCISWQSCQAATSGVVQRLSAPMLKQPAYRRPALRPPALTLRSHHGRAAMQP